MDDMNLDRLIASLEEDYVKYRNICCFKLKAIKDPCFTELKKCAVCNGYSSVTDCYEFIDIPHIIRFYKEYYNDKEKK